MYLSANKIWLAALGACLLPLVTLGLDITQQQLGANPVQALHIRLGDWSLRFLWLTLAITPLQTVSKWPGMAAYRQLLGLTSFCYATLHLIGYLWLDHVWVWPMIAADVMETRYIWFGILAYVILLVLAATSHKFAKKRLGRNWKKLHRLIYIAAGAAMFHYFWQLKGNRAEPLFYLALIFVLLGFRAVTWYKKLLPGRLDS